jgi:peptide/nickel transport system substrate-binding protein
MTACSGVDTTINRVPSPPFEGEPPSEPYLYKGEPGLYGGTLVLAQTSDMNTFNIITASGTSSVYILQVHVFRCLVDYRNGDDPPGYDSGLCTRWEMSPDAKQWTFYLRPGVRWSDGHPFTADDVIFTYNVICDAKIDSSLRDPIKEGRDESGQPIYPEIKKLDELTVQFNLNSPNIAFLDVIYNMWLVPKHKWEGAWKSGTFNEAMKLSENPSNLVSLGPFRIKEYVSGQRVVLERNPYFWKVDRKGQRLPYLDRIVFVIAQNFDTITSKFKAGEIDAMWKVRANEYRIVERLAGPDVVVHNTGTSCDQNWLAFNLNNSVNPKTGRPYVASWKQRIFRNRKFRQAVSYAIDRQAIINTVYETRGVPLYSFTTPGDTYWYPGSAKEYPHDPEQARKLLDEIGLTDTDGDGIREDSEGHDVDFSITAFSGNDQRLKTVSVIAASLKEVGLMVKPDPVPFQTVLSRTEVTFDFDAVTSGWQSGTPPGPINVKNILLSSATQHVCFPKQQAPSTEWEAEIDRLVHALDASIDEAERKRIYAEINRIWSEQLPEINLVAEKHAVAYKSKIGNVRPSNLFAHVTWNCEELYVKDQ